MKYAMEVEKLGSGVTKLLDHYSDNEVATFFKFDKQDNSMDLGFGKVSPPPGYEYILIPYFGILMDSNLSNEEKLLILSFSELKY